MPETLPQIDDLLPVGVLRVDADRRIVSANARAHAILDVAPGRLPGRSVMEAFLDAAVEALLDGIPVGGAVTGEARLGKGAAHTTVIRGHRLADDDLLVILEDVSELRRLRQIRSEFIDNLSHELRTPLSTVSLLAETLARDAATADVPPKMRDRIGLIEVETGHLVQMVNELLDLARIEGGSQLRLEDEISLPALAAASVERIRLFADRQGVALAVTADPDVPTVTGDEGRLGQVLLNLLHNAVKFSPDGGEVTVSIRSDAEAGLVEVAVRDQGMGIPRADRARIFERFYKADRARVRGGGTGLGLAIARHIVEGHGGRIGVESDEGRGSTFTFTIPVAGPPSETPGAATSIDPSA